MTDARTLTRSLGGTWHGHYGQAPCPVCQPERRRDQHALSLGDRTDGTGLLLHCFKRGCDFRAVLAAAGVDAASSTLAVTARPATAWRELDRRRDEDLARRAQQARDVWAEAKPITGSLAEVYLRSRGITCSLPPTLRFHPACWHPSAQRLPALVALIEGGPQFGVHRTYLRRDGSGKAHMEPAKAMLGAVSGGAVRLVEAPANSAAPLVAAEGIETAMSLASGLLRGPATVWAALSASGMAGLRLPPTTGRLLVASDGDEAGRTAAQSLAERAHAEGWRVSLLPAPEGMDWNDVLRLGDAKGEAA